MSDPDPTAPTAGTRRSRSSSACRSRRTAPPDSPAFVAAVVAAVLVAAAADSSLSLLAYGDVVAGCTRCALAATRTQVVFGSGSPHADLMFVGEAPGFHEDKQGVPVRRCGREAARQAARRDRAAAATTSTSPT